MTGSWNRARVRKYFDSLFWPVLLLGFLLTLLLVSRLLGSSDFSSVQWSELSFSWLLLAVVLQAVTAILVVLGWRRNLALHGVGLIGCRQAIAMIGINALGKYAPGKVAGVVARGAAQYRLHGDPWIALQAAVVEQGSMLHSCMALALVAWCFASGHAWTGLGAAMGTLVSVLVARAGGQFIVALAARVLRKPDVRVGGTEGFRRSYPVMFLVMASVWILSAAVLYCCILTLDVALAPDFLWLLWVLALAYMGGFAAFFLPAGLGAREGVLLLLLGTQMDPVQALHVAVLHRLVTVLIDLLLGAGALLFGRTLLAAR
jgi:uncharacterized membrane protein YbhN (UPF0104 family)